MDDRENVKIRSAEKMMEKRIFWITPEKNILKKEFHSGGVMSAMEKEKIRRYLADLEGRNVELYAVGERNRVTKAQGILEGVYPDVFTVSVEYSGYTQRYCYTYSEVMTKNVRVSAVK